MVMIVPQPFLKSPATLSQAGYLTHIAILVRYQAKGAGIKQSSMQRTKGQAVINLIRPSVLQPLNVGRFQSQELGANFDIQPAKSTAIVVDAQYLRIEYQGFSRLGGLLFPVLCVVV